MSLDGDIAFTALDRESLINTVAVKRSMAVTSPLP
jgi:hypothetical protein